MNVLTISAAVVIYSLILLKIAQNADQGTPSSAKTWASHPAIYIFALGIYCTSWSFYGLVGTASMNLLSYLPILLGPLLLFTVGFPIVKRIAAHTRTHRLNSIADFLAFRYGRRQGIAALVTLILLVATVPYIALQLKAIVDSVLFLIGDNGGSRLQASISISSVILIFIILFASKQIDLSRYQSGLMSVIAVESIVKLIAISSVGILALMVISQQSAPLESAIINSHTAPISGLRFITETFVAATTVFCLPRMFRVAFVELPKLDYLDKSRLGFCAYLLIITLSVGLIAIASNILNLAVENRDLYALALPLATGNEALSLFVFIGGFSAASAMIFVATTTLSQMLSNDVILPLLIQRNKRKSRHLHHHFSRAILISRRATILLIFTSAFCYQLFLASNTALTSIGLIAFTLISQLSPAILLGSYWDRANAKGVYRALSIGCLTWGYMMIIPLLANADIIHGQWIKSGFFGIHSLAPTTFLQFISDDVFTRTVIASLTLNTLTLVLFSSRNQTSLSDRVQSHTFTLADKQPTIGTESSSIAIAVDDIQELLKQFIGHEQTALLISQYPSNHKTASTELITAVELRLSNLVGHSSSKALVHGLAKGNHFVIEEVVNIFEDTTRALRQKQEIISASFEHISSGISVVNENLEVVAWNRRYEQMFNYPDGMLTQGRNVEEIFRFNAKRGILGAGDIEELVHKRLEHLKNGGAYRVVRQHQDITFEIRGTPLPAGGYVTTYEDITEFMVAQQALEAVNSTLESRIKERTRELETVNTELVKQINHGTEVEQQLIKSKAFAEQTSREKTKLLALASHDILQPLNAASLYAGALKESANDQHVDVIEKLQSSISAAETIISSLLEISKLDSGRLTARQSPVCINSLFELFKHSYGVQAKEGVDIDFVATQLQVMTDVKYLARILQNFVSNAVKYTDSGRVLMGCRRRKDSVEIQIWDTGHGISKENQLRIFEDFYRVQKHADQSGIGLGLAVAMRFAELLSLKINVHSTLGKGSCFSVTVPRATQKAIMVEPTIQAASTLTGLNVIYVDDDKDNLNATTLLLQEWNCNISTYQTIDEALSIAGGEGPDILLMDFQLDRQDWDGVSLAQHLTASWDGQQAVCIISAEPDNALAHRIKENGYSFIRKPVKPAKLRAVFNRLQTQLPRYQDQDGPI